MSEDKKKVVIFSCFYTPYVSGAERFAIEIAGRLAVNYDITVITALLDRAHSPEEVYEGADGSTYLLKRVGVGSWVLDRFLYVILAPMAAKKIQPQIIHAVMESYAGGALFNTRWIMRGAQFLKILTLQSGEQESLKKRLKVPWPLRKLIYQTPDVTTAISTYLKNRAQKYGAKNVVVIPNGVERNALKEIKEEVGKKVHHRIVCVARLSWEKGHKYLLSAFTEARKSYPDSRLVLVGGGSSEGEIKKQAGELQIFDYIDFKGELAHKEALAEIARGEVFVCTSLFEGLGIVFIEAQALGTPVIGTDVGGIPDVIENGVTGLLVPPKDSSMLKEAIEEIFMHPDKAEKMAKKAEERLEKFSWEKIAEQVAQIYEQA